VAFVTLVLFAISAETTNGQLGLAPDSSDEQILAAVEGWLTQTGLPTRMGPHGISEQRIDDLVAAISRQRVAGVFGDDFGEAGIRRLYTESL
jgi:hypothetical protein